MNLSFLGRRRGLPVLMFHGLCDRVPECAVFPGGRTCLLAVEQFSALMEWCAERYDFVRLEELDKVAAGGRSGRPAILLTFDDGLASVVDLAVPVLKEHGASAVVFVTTAWTEAGRTPDIFALERVVWQRLPVDLSVTANGQRLDLRIGAPAEVSRAFTKLWRFLFAIRFPPLALEGRHVLINGETWESREEPQDRQFWFPASWAELRAGVAAGVLEIGSHMVSHVPLPWLSEAERGRQLGHSRDVLSEAFGRPVIGCAYPHGLADERTLAQAGEVYRWSFTTQRGRLVPRTSRSGVPRYHVPGEAPGLLTRELAYGRAARWLGRLGL